MTNCFQARRRRELAERAKGERCRFGQQAQSRAAEDHRLHSRTSHGRPASEEPLRHGRKKQIERWFSRLGENLTLSTLGRSVVLLVCDNRSHSDLRDKRKRVDKPHWLESMVTTVWSMDTTTPMSSCAPTHTHTFSFLLTTQIRSPAFHVLYQRTDNVGRVTIKHNFTAAFASSSGDTQDPGTAMSLFILHDDSRYSSIVIAKHEPKGSSPDSVASHRQSVFLYVSEGDALRTSSHLNKCLSCRARCQSRDYISASSHVIAFSYRRRISVSNSNNYEEA